MRSSLVERSGRKAASVLLAAFLLIAAAASAARHTELIASDPPAEAHVAAGVERVRLLFSEPIEAGLAHVTLRSSDGTVQVPTVEGDPRDVNAIVARVPPLADAAFRLSWRVVSADGHPVAGSYVFWVGDDPSATPPAEGSSEQATAQTATTAWATASLTAFLRGAALAALLTIAGILFFLVRVEGDEAVAIPEAMRVARLAALGAPALLGAHVLLWSVAASRDGALELPGIVTALRSGIGQLELWRLTAALLTAWALCLARRPGLALGFATVAVVMSAALGHAAAFTPLISVPAKALHLLAAATWIGGLTWLLAHRRCDVVPLARVASGVSRTALGSVVLVAASGLAQSLILLPTPISAIGTAYGNLLIAKVVGTLALVAFGAHHRFRALPGLLAPGASGASLASSLKKELFVMAIVTLLGGALATAALPPAGHAHQADGSTPVESDP